MDLFDFDGTIFNGESFTDFSLFLVKKKPWLLVFAPISLTGLLALLLFPGHMEFGKAWAFLPLRWIDYRLYLPEFWDRMKADGRFASFFTPDRVPSLVVSASPRELVEAALTGQYACPLIASEMDLKTGRFASPNNRGEEKVRRIRALYPDTRFERVYTDHPGADAPLLSLGKEGYRVKKGVAVRIR